MLSPARRRELGAYYTPSDVAARLVGLALDGTCAAPRVLDPACGDGSFLLAAARHLAGRGLPRQTIVRELVWGCDVDAGAVGAARRALATWSGADPGAHLWVGDGLAAGERVDVVVGNPPFLNDRRRRAVRGAYRDTAWTFLAHAASIAERVVLIQPQSVVAAREAAGLRDALAPRLEGMWWCHEALFDASVRVCAPVLGTGGAGSVRRWSGRGVEPLVDSPRVGGAWGTLVSDAPPVARSARTLRELASATAGFRDEFYGLRGAVDDEPAGDAPLLVTSGLIDVGRIAWGDRPARFDGRRYAHPRVALDRISGRVRTWVDARLRPKVVLATQTRVLEAAVDAGGQWVPCTPVVSVHPHDEADVWRVGAALLAPTASAWAARLSAGAALQPGAIKLSAQQVLDAPLPADEPVWDEGAAALQAGDVASAALLLARAHAAAPEVHAWWRDRWVR